MGCPEKFDPATSIPDLSGKVIIVTGANTGIGFATVQHLARRGAKVYLGARSEAKAKAAIELLNKQGLGPGNGEVVWLNVDLSEPQRAKAAAEEFLKKEERLDVLINNAAIVVSLEVKKSYYDVQDCMMVNHICPFIFTQTLLPLMKETAKQPGSDVRIVILSSDAQHFIPLGARFRNKDDLNEEYKGQFMASMKRYGLSKLAVTLFARQLQKNLDQEGVPIIVTYIEPGVVNSLSNPDLAQSDNNKELIQGVNGVARFFMVNVYTKFLPPTTKGAYAPVFAAASPLVREDAERYKGQYIVSGRHAPKFGKPSQDALDDNLAAELWETTENVLREAGTM